MIELHSVANRLPDFQTTARVSASAPLCAIAYRSRGSAPLDFDALAHLLEKARDRNRKHGITGMLAVDRGSFFQWLEGPPDAVQAVWNSIRNDRRHGQVQLLGRIDLTVRIFNGWDMNLAWRNGNPAQSASSSGVEIPGLMLDAMHEQTSLVLDIWQRLGALPPQLSVGHHSVDSPISLFAPVQLLAPDSQLCTEKIEFIASSDVLTDLVARSLGQDAGASGRMVDALRLFGLSPTSILLDLFEPAARRLGDLWRDDECSEFDLTIAMGRLQVLTRRLGGELQHNGRLSRRPGKVLVAVQPSEQHMLVLGIGSEFLWQAGWDVTCAFPSSDEELRQLVADTRFDVLSLSLCDVFRRDHRLAAMAASVRTARAQSNNPALIVLASGRIFHDHPEFSMLVGADAGCQTAAKIVPYADSLSHSVGSLQFVHAQNALAKASEKIVAKAFDQAASVPQLAGP